ncbi:hypothetical protein EDC01DRAFT_628394 [Geopyxis carbonaria]|nr:hypothetical protein EDC01DRAFT_628394 [Geopyxis carbonaria]
MPRTRSTAAMPDPFRFSELPYTAKREIGHLLSTRDLLSLRQTSTGYRDLYHYVLLNRALASPTALKDHLMRIAVNVSLDDALYIDRRARESPLLAPSLWSVYQALFVRVYTQREWYGLRDLAASRWWKLYGLWLKDAAGNIQGVIEFLSWIGHEGVPGSERAQLFKMLSLRGFPGTREAYDTAVHEKVIQGIWRRPICYN